MLIQVINAFAQTTTGPPTTSPVSSGNVSMLEALGISVLAAVIFTILVWAGKGIWLWVGENLFLKITSRHITRISGTWEAEYTAPDNAYSYKETLVIEQYAWKIRGHFRYQDTFANSPTKDIVKEFDLEGILKGTVFTAYYWGRDKSLLGSGCITLRLLTEVTMDGGCIYYDPGSGKVLTDMYAWKKVRDGA
jgi:hypothetical protein